MKASKKLWVVCASAAALVSVAGCESAPKAAQEHAEKAAAATGAAAGKAAQAVKKEAAGMANAAHTALAGGMAKVGTPAPDFTLKDLDGKEVKLSEFKGKTVVLEWFNPGCPFVKASHTEGSLKGMAMKHKDVVWLAINSGGPGKQGHGVDPNRAAAQQFQLGHPVLVDADGVVGKLYGAQRTPHMFVIDPAGKLVYRGAVDNSPDGAGKSPKGGALVNYVENALTAIQSSRAVEPAETAPYGCSVKYRDS